MKKYYILPEQGIFRLFLLTVFIAFSFNEAEAFDKIRLIEAVKSNDLEAVKEVLEFDSPFAVDEDGFNALHHAAALDHDAIATLLVVESRKLLSTRTPYKKTKAIDLAAEGYDTPIHIAARNNSLKVLGAFYHLGANFEELNKNEDTPLVVACRAGHLEAVKFLVLHGADVFYKTNVKQAYKGLYSEKRHAKTAAALNFATLGLGNLAVPLSTPFLPYRCAAAAEDNKHTHVSSYLKSLYADPQTLQVNQEKVYNAKLSHINDVLETQRREFIDEGNYWPLLDFARISRALYKDKGYKVPGFKYLKSYSENGMKARYYYNEANNVGVIGFRGTENSDDVMRDMSLGVEPLQALVSICDLAAGALDGKKKSKAMFLKENIEYAIDDAKNELDEILSFDKRVFKRAQSIFPAEAQIFVTGHSLGGVHAQIGGMYGFSGATFNSPGLTKTLRQKLKNKSLGESSIFYNHRIKGDLVAKYSSDKAFGEVVDHPPLKSNYGKLELHSIKNFVRLLETYDHETGQDRSYSSNTRKYFFLSQAKPTLSPEKEESSNNSKKDLFQKAIDLFF